MGARSVFVFSTFKHYLEMGARSVNNEVGVLIMGIAENNN